MAAVVAVIAFMSFSCEPMPTLVLRQTIAWCGHVGLLSRLQSHLTGMVAVWTVSTGLHTSLRTFHPRDPILNLFLFVR